MRCSRRWPRRTQQLTLGHQHPPWHAQVCMNVRSGTPVMLVTPAYRPCRAHPSRGTGRVLREVQPSGAQNGQAAHAGAGQAARLHGCVANHSESRQGRWARVGATNPKPGRKVMLCAWANRSGNCSCLQRTSIRAELDKPGAQQDAVISALAESMGGTESILRAWLQGEGLVAKREFWWLVTSCYELRCFTASLVLAGGRGRPAGSHLGPGASGSAGPAKTKHPKRLAGAAGRT